MTATRKEGAARDDEATLDVTGPTPGPSGSGAPGRLKRTPLKRTPFRRRAPKAQPSSVDTSTRDDTGRKPLPRRSALRGVSKKQAKRERALVKLKAQLFEERGDWCQACQILWRHRTGQAVALARPSDGCGGTAHDAHHVIPRSLGGPDTAANLLLVSRTHHDWVERIENREEAMACGLLRGSASTHVRMIERRGA